MGEQYGADQIQILEGLEAVRKRPGMYIGSTSARGLHHLVYEIVDNAVDEALAGYCDSIDVTINPDNSITVIDDGRGMPTGKHAKTGKSTVETIFTVLHAGGKFGQGGYKTSGGLHGVGSSVVNALSSHLTVEIVRDHQKYQEDFENGGHPVGTLRNLGKTKAGNGTTITFKPDSEMFTTITYNFDTLATRLRESAFLLKGVKITLTDEREGKEREEVYQYDDGINKYVFKGTDKLKLNKPYDNYNNIHNSNLNNSNCNAYDVNAVNKLCDIYIYLCGVYDKEISIMGFSKLSGIDWNSINVWSHEEPSSPRLGIYQKLCKEREESLSSKLIAGAKNPVGVIAVLNRQFGWASPYTADSNRQKQALTVDQLPQLGETNSQNIKAVTSDNMVDNAK